MAQTPSRPVSATENPTMKNASGDIVGILVFVCVLIFQAISHFVNAAKEKNKPKSTSESPTPPRQNAPQQPQRNPDEYSDPFDELLEALGKKPGQTPPQIPQPPQQAKPSRPIPPLTPAAPPMGEVMYPHKPVVIPEKPRQPMPLEQSAPSMVTATNDTARAQAKIAQSESKPVFETSIGSHISASQKAAEKIASSSGAPSDSQLQKAYRPAEKSVRLPELVARLKNPVEIRRAIIANEILGAPVGLRES